MPGNREAPFSGPSGFVVGVIVKSSLFFSLTAFTLLIALTVGGATRQGLGSDAIPELVSLPLLAMALPRAWPSLKRSRSALALAIGVVALPCLQLVPLPFWLWSLLPGRQSIVDILATAGAPLSWRPISLIPAATERALLSLLPGLAIFLSVLSLDRTARTLLLLLAAAIGVLSALIAMLQVLGGLDSGLYFFSFTNVGRGVGFFANANDFAAFEYVLLPLAAAALSEIQIRSLAYSLAVFGLVVPALLFGLALSGSRSAIILGVVSILATMPLVLGPEIARWGRRRTLWLVAFLGLALVPLMGGLGLMTIFTRFATQDVVEDLRWIIAGETWRAILTFAPFGAGVGTFPRVYPLHESAAALVPELVNRAHDDLLETLFEGGLGSLALLLAFLGWFFLTMRRILFGDLESRRSAGARRRNCNRAALGAFPLGLSAPDDRSRVVVRSLRRSTVRSAFGLGRSSRCLVVAPGSKKGVAASGGARDGRRSPSRSRPSQQCNRSIAIYNLSERRKICGREVLFSGSGRSS